MKSLTSGRSISLIMKTPHSAVEFYDQIAIDYDQKMEDDLPNRQVRAEVSSYFLEHVKEGVILDFGAGTGLDLNWQLAAGYQIIFYEPSSNMAAQADKRHDIQENPVIQTMIGTEATIEKMKSLKDSSLDAVFSNFAALNSVDNLDDVFSVFSQKLKPKGHLICVLTHNFGFVNRIKSFFKQRLAMSKSAVAKSIVMEDCYAMNVYYHSSHSIKKSGLKNGLNLEHERALGFEDHVLSHLIKM